MLVICEYLLVFRPDQLDLSVRHYWIVLAQGYKLFIEVENRVRVSESLFHVYLWIIRVKHYPWCSAGKASIFAAVPRHRCSCVIAGFAMYSVPHKLLTCTSPAAVFCKSQALYVPELTYVGPGHVDHT